MVSAFSAIAGEPRGMAEAAGQLPTSSKLPRLQALVIDLAFASHRSYLEETRLPRHR
ncbi:MAG: hypothetical protein M2R45_00626 [Verrucomicrobia subdivision 3 bacterium]|nr:hypothetical protein [Limisphaerales bacterium]MCS1414491.1 hypothetical protein [Limisphaerales bacterium]